jgi:hypothetical protein
MIVTEFAAGGPGCCWDATPGAGPKPDTELPPVVSMVSSNPLRFARFVGRPSPRGSSSSPSSSELESSTFMMGGDRVGIGLVRTRIFFRM